MYDVIVVGAGPAGIFAAINTAIDNKKVLLIEKKASLGKKLLISGKGQCNITHTGEIKDFLEHYGPNFRFLRNSLYEFDNKKLEKFFNQRGLHFVTDDNGKLFPQSLKANDVLDVLINECKFRNVEIKCNHSVEKIEKNDKFFSVICNQNSFEARNVVITTGGCSYPHTGSEGDGYIFARKLGHTISPVSPALTAVYVKDYKFTSLAGISVNLPVTLWRDAKKIKTFSGDLLFTHKNLSGPVIINNSRYINKDDVLKFNFLAVKDEEMFRKKFIEYVGKNGQMYVKTIIKEYDLPKRLVEHLLKISNVSEELKCSQLTKKLRNTLITNLISFEMEVSKLEGYKLAMVTKGGVSIKEVNMKTMESKLVEGLYFAGEVLDIDGDTGGYNIQAAFSTAKLASNSINKKLFK